MTDGASTGRAALLAAVGSVVLWLTLISIFQPGPIADEAGHHLPAIRQLYEGEWSLPAHLPMFPGYHAAAAIICKLFGANLLVLRAFSAAMFIGAIIIFRAALHRRGSPCVGAKLLLFAWLPILFPFSVLAYTESASMLLLVVALYFYVRRKPALSAGALLVACLVRQSNIVWAAMLGVLTAIEVFRQDGDSMRSKEPRALPVPLMLRQCGPFVVVVAAAAVLICFMLARKTGYAEANRPRFNVAQFYLFAIFVLLLFLPILGARIPEGVRALRQWCRGGRGRGLVLVISAVVAVVCLADLFRNPHPWNENVAYFRNWILVLMSRSWIARGVVALLIVGGGAIIVAFTVRQSNRARLGIVWLFTLLYLLPHSLAEPRYYIISLFFLNFFTDYRPAEARRLVFWYWTVCTAVGVAILMQAGPEGGVW